MMDEMFSRPHRRKVQDLNIVPILDMLTTVIFFMLLSVTFLELVKVTVPPSATTTVAPSAGPPPAQPRMTLLPAKGGLRLELRWSGANPGSSAAVIEATDPDKRRAEIVEKSGRLSKAFAQTYPGEKTLQLGLGSRLGFQNLISVMDGVRAALPDIVLISYADAESAAGGGE